MTSLPRDEYAKSTPAIRSMRSDDLPALHALSLAVGWPHRLDDWALVHGLGQGIVACDAADHVIGSAVRWSFGPDLGAVGMVIVSPAHQGSSVGTLLFGALLEGSDCATLVLNSTAAGRSLYESRGFKRLGDIAQRQGTPALNPEPTDGICHSVQPLADRDWPAIFALDALAFGADRSEVLSALGRIGPGTVFKREGEILGYAFRRQFGLGHLVGPIVATEDAIAIAVTRPHLLAQPGELVRVDTPYGRGRFAEFLEEARLVQVGSVVTMARGPLARLDGHARIYGLANQALG
jgi:Acetyltransferase (GNAT) domain